MYSKGRSSIKWRIMLIYLVIVFIAMAISGVFITYEFENYRIDEVRSDCMKTADMVELSVPFSDFTSLKPGSDEVEATQKIIAEWRTGTEFELYVINSDFEIVSSGNSSAVERSSIGYLSDEAVTRALSGESSENMERLSTELPIMDCARPLRGADGRIIGVLYIRADLSGIYDMTNEAEAIFLRAMMLALTISVVITYIITNNITGPIKDLTKKAAHMAAGDFSQSIEVKSDDEIGRLAEMFNYLREELDNNINEITDEKSKLELILKNIADGIIASNTDGEIIHINPAAVEYLNLGNRKDNPTFEEILKIIGWDTDLADVQSKIAEIFSNEETEIISLQNKTLMLRYAGLMNKYGTDIGGIVLIQDITERTKLDAMQKEFVANVSHELRTPITTIKSYAETLSDDPDIDAGTRLRFLSVIDEESSRMAHLVTDLLQLARLDNKRETMEMVPLNVNELMQSCIDRIIFMADTKKQTVSLNGTVVTAGMSNDDYNAVSGFNRDITINADREKMQQALLNILTNSIKYTSEGGRIDIKTEPHDAVVKIIVTDNGMGIGKGDLKRIFDRFYRVDKARSRALGGTGLGLSIAKHIVEVHRGTIYADSIEGEGTTMTVVLPLAEEGDIHIGDEKQG